MGDSAHAVESLFFLSFFYDEKFFESSRGFAIIKIDIGYLKQSIKEASDWKKSVILYPMLHRSLM